ncbi:LPXTG cell wall anchor domain-containing protein, partial [Ligilactobacillus salivarius]
DAQEVKNSDAYKNADQGKKANQTTKKEAQRLPQTGDTNDARGYMFGSILGLLGLGLGFLRKKKRSEKD